MPPSVPQAILILLAQLSVWVSLFCSLSAGEDFDVVRLPVLAMDVQDVVVLSDGDVMVAARPLPSSLAVDLTRVTPTAEERVGAIPALFPGDLAESFTVEGDRWWFSRMGMDGSTSVVHFVEGGETVRQTRVTLTRRYPLIWMPIPGHEPRGLSVSIEREQPALRIDEVSPSAVTQVAALEWWQSAAGNISGSHDSKWSTESLADGRFAVVTVDDPPGAGLPRLRIIGAGQATEHELPCPVGLAMPIDTAVDVAGRLAVVGLSGEKEVVAAFVHVDDPDAADCRVLTAPDEAAAYPPFLGVPSVVATSEGFIVGWTREDGTVRAAQLGAVDDPLLILDVGEDAERLRPLRQLIHVEADTVRFVWKQRNGDIVARRLPKSLTEYARLVGLRQLFCSTSRD